MNRIRIKGLLFLPLLVIVSCKQEVKEVSEIKDTMTSLVVNKEAYSKKLNDWFEEQFQEDLSRSPMKQSYLGIKTASYGEWDDISSEKEVENQELAKKRLAYLKDSVEVANLDDVTAMSYRLMKQNLENELNDYPFRLYDYPVNQMHGMQAEIPSFLISIHSIKDTVDAKAYISRLYGIKPMFAQLVENIKIREKNGIVLPKFVFAKVLDDSRNIISGKPFDGSNKESTLLMDFKEKVTVLEISDEQKKELIFKAEKGLLEGVKPGYDGLISLLEEQQQRATTEDGVWKFPKGDKFYANALQRTTTTDMTSDQIHELGLKEVTRIHIEMRKIMKKVRYEGTLKDFFMFMKEDPQFYFTQDEKGKAAYLEQAVGLIDTMKSKLNKLFIAKPKADIIVKQVEAFREKSAGTAFYEQGTPDGARPGIYYANLYDMKGMPRYQMEALAYHEGIPGHHMQISIAQELKGLPKFRKYGGNTAYIEGWGLYSEFLPKEIGMYSDPYSDFGRLAMELWRACRLVVDTGIHQKKWTREDGIKYYTDNTPNAESDAVKMVERHIVMPSQATAYKIGMNKILELRETARKVLGDKFDIREFHDVVLTNGAVPLTILEDLMAVWISEKSVTKTQEVGL